MEAEVGPENVAVREYLERSPNLSNAETRELEKLQKVNQRTDQHSQWLFLQTALCARRSQGFVSNARHLQELLGGGVRHAPVFCSLRNSDGTSTAREARYPDSPPPASNRSLRPPRPPLLRGYRPDLRNLASMQSRKRPRDESWPPMTCSTPFRTPRYPRFGNAPLS